MHSEKYDEVKRFYDSGAWRIERVHNAVGKWITGDEYRDISGFEYPNME